MKSSPSYPSFGWAGGFPCAVYVPLGEANSCYIPRTPGLAISVPPSEVVEQLPLGCRGALTQNAQDVTVVHPRSVPTEGEGIPVARCANGRHAIPSGRGYDRCLSQDGAWCVTNRTGPVVPAGMCELHDCAAAAGCASGTQALPAISGGETCP